MTQQLKMIDKNNILKIIRQKSEHRADQRTKENGPKFFKKQNDEKIFPYPKCEQNE